MDRDPLARPEEAIRRVYAYTAFRIGDGADAEDAVSETIERALRYRDSYDHRKGPPIAWLIGIARHVLADAASERSRRIDADVTAVAGVVEDVAGLVERSTDLRRALAQLDDRSRELLALRYGADLKAREIASLWDMRTNAIEVALHRALAQLRAILKEGAPDEQPGASAAGLEGEE
jgi:RNA polymerase sigma-70 factor, ECF subfamily